MGLERRTQEGASSVQVVGVYTTGDLVCNLLRNSSFITASNYLWYIAFQVMVANSSYFGCRIKYNLIKSQLNFFFRIASLFLQDSEDEMELHLEGTRHMRVQVILDISGSVIPAKEELLLQTLYNLGMIMFFLSKRPTLLPGCEKQSSNVVVNNG